MVHRQQLEEIDRQIANFQEQAHEHNVIIKNLQDRMLLIEAPRGWFWQRRRKLYAGYYEHHD